MYWYLSFLRPPPVALTLPSEVVITPQVANDLRTELRLEPTEIYYTWSRESPPAITKPVHLTRYEPPVSTYRPITVPLPKGARAGEKWRLGLSTGPEVATPLLDLAGSEVGVLGVWSEGIELKREVAAGPSGAVRGVGQEKGKGKKKDEGKPSKDKDKKKEKEMPKQTRISRSWPLPRDKGSLKLVEQTSFDLDKKVWDSGLALSAWLWTWWDKKHANPVARGVIDRLQEGSGPLLELGSGTGLVSIALALLDPSLRLTATDLDSAMEIMRENITLNGVDVAAEVLDWDAPPASATASVVVAADVTYNTASFPALVGTLEQLLLGEGHPPLLLAYKQRDVAERDLWDMLKEKKIGSVLVDRVRGAEDDGQVEIWVCGRDIE